MKEALRAEIAFCMNLAMKGKRFFHENIFTTGTLHAIVYKSQAMCLWFLIRAGIPAILNGGMLCRKRKKSYMQPLLYSAWYP